MSTRVREVESLTTAHHQQEGAGFVVRRPFPTVGLDAVDPFLLIDEMGPVDYAPGEAIGLIGPSGSGKSTLLMVMAGLERPDSGEVVVNGTPFNALDEDALVEVASTYQVPDML